MDSPHRTQRAASRAVHRQERASPYMRPNTTNTNTNTNSPHTPLPRNPSSRFSALLSSIGSLWRRSVDVDNRTELDEDAGQDGEEGDGDVHMADRSAEALHTPVGPPGGFAYPSSALTSSSPIDPPPRTRRLADTHPGPSSLGLTYAPRPAPYPPPGPPAPSEFLRRLADTAPAPPALTPKEITNELATFFERKKQGRTDFSLIELNGVQRLLDNLKAGATAPEPPFVLPAPAFRPGARDRPHASQSTPHLFDRSLPRRTRHRPAYIGAGFGGTSRLRPSGLLDFSVENTSRPEIATADATKADNADSGVGVRDNDPSTLHASMLRSGYDDASENEETLPFSASAFISPSDIQSRLTILRESISKNEAENAKTKTSPPKKGPSAAASLLLDVLADEKKQSPTVNPYQSRPGAVKPPKSLAKSKSTKSTPGPSAPAPAPPRPRQPMLAYDMLQEMTRNEALRASPPKATGNGRPPSSATSASASTSIPKEPSAAPGRSSFFYPPEPVRQAPKPAAAASTSRPDRPTPASKSTAPTEPKRSQPPPPSRSTSAPKQQEVVELLDSDDEEEGEEEEEEEEEQAPPPKKAKQAAASSSAQPKSAPFGPKSKQQQQSGSGPVAGFNFGAAAATAAGSPQAASAPKPPPQPSVSQTSSKPKPPSTGTSTSFASPFGGAPMSASSAFGGGAGTNSGFGGGRAGGESSVFGSGKAAGGSTNVFGSSSSSKAAASPFGGSSSNAGTSADVFGGKPAPSPFGASASNSSSSSNVFGGKPAASPFGGVSSSSNVFGTKQPEAPATTSTTPTSAPPPAKLAAGAGFGSGAGAKLSFGEIASRTTSAKPALGTFGATQPPGQPSSAMDVDGAKGSASPLPPPKVGGTSFSAFSAASFNAFMNPSHSPSTSTPSFSAPQSSSSVPAPKVSESSLAPQPFRPTQPHDSSAMSVDKPGLPSESASAIGSAFPAAQRAITPTDPAVEEKAAPSPFAFSSQVGSAKASGSGPRAGSSFGFGQPSSSAGSKLATTEGAVTGFGASEPQAPAVPSSSLSLDMPQATSTPLSNVSPQHPKPAKDSVPSFVFDVSLIDPGKKTDTHALLSNRTTLPKYLFTDALKTASTISKEPEAVKTTAAPAPAPTSGGGGFDWAAAGLQPPKASVGKKTCGICGCDTDASLTECEVCQSPL